MYKRTLEIASYTPEPDVQHRVEELLWDELEGEIFCQGGETTFEGKKVHIPATREEFRQGIHYVCSGQFDLDRNAIEVEVTLHVPTLQGGEVTVYRKRTWMALNGTLCSAEGQSLLSPEMQEWES